MLVNISKSLKQKGQGIVEYAILLAFIVGLAMMLNGTNLGGAVKGTFDSVADLLASFNGGKTKVVARVPEAIEEINDLINILNVVNNFCLQS